MEGKMVDLAKKRVVENLLGVLYEMFGDCMIAKDHVDTIRIFLATLYDVMMRRLDLFEFVSKLESHPNPPETYKLLIDAILHHFSGKTNNLYENRGITSTEVSLWEFLYVIRVVLFSGKQVYIDTAKKASRRGLIVLSKETLDCYNLIKRNMQWLQNGFTESGDFVNFEDLPDDGNVDYLSSYKYIRLMWKRDISVMDYLFYEDFIDLNYAVYKCLSQNKSSYNYTSFVKNIIALYEEYLMALDDTAGHKINRVYYTKVDVSSKLNRLEGLVYDVVSGNKITI